jgi:adenosylhomocysteine nucleosidase
MKSQGKLNIIVALASEARLFLDKYRLSRMEHSGVYPIYVNAKRNIHLVVSGVGKIKAAAALSYLHALSGGESHTCYLNVGIAGAAELAVGEIFQAQRITDAGAGKTFYPALALLDQLPSQPVLTVDKPLAQYPHDGLVEMEAFGYHQAALGLVVQEQVMTVKIISDNAVQSVQQVNSALVVELLRNNSVMLSKVIYYLLDLSHAEAQQQVHLQQFPDFCARFHVTAYQRHQLSEILRRWYIHFPAENPLTICIAAANIAGAFNILNQHLNSVLICKSSILNAR